MNNKKNAGVLIATGAVFLAIVLTVTTVADASRNSSGTMSAANGPYVPGTTITSTTINSRFADIENEITDSLSRSGKGGMTAALRGSNGTVAAPEFSFTNDTGSGLYRAASNDLRFAVNGADVSKWTAGRFSVSNGSSGATANAASSAVIESSASHFLSLLAPNASHSGILFGDVAGSSSGFIQYNNSADSTPNTMFFAAAGSTRVTITSGGLTIGSTGTAISASYRGAVVWNPGNQAANSCVENNITVTGAAVGAECAMSQGSTFGGFGMTYTCYVTATNVCTIRACNVSTVLQAVSQGTYTCRVFNP